MLVRFGSIAIGVVALVQWWQLADRASHIARMYWKFGDFPVTTSVFGLSLFLTCSLLAAAAGIAIVRYTQSENGWVYRVARLSTIALVVGAIVWPVAVASPLVRVVAG